jgi:septin family protein
MEGWWQNESLLKFETPTSMFIVGPSNSGKTFFIKRLLEMSSGMFKAPPSRIYFCFSVWQELYDQMSKNVPNIHFRKGLPSMEELG